MSAFTFPYTSSTPSTPEPPSRKTNSGAFSSWIPNPSTTPAGPPPSSTASFTPAGPPPLFASSQLGSVLDKSPLFPRSKDVTFAGFASSPPLPRAKEDESMLDLGQGIGEEDSFEENLPDHEASETAIPLDGTSQFGAGSLASMGLPTLTPQYNTFQFPMDSSFQNSNKLSTKKPVTSQKPKPLRERKFDRIANSIISRGKPSAVYESDVIILETHSILNQISALNFRTPAKRHSSLFTLSGLCSDLIKLWESFSAEAQKNTNGSSHLAALGPSSNSPPFCKAIFLSSFLLSLHQPLGADSSELPSGSYSYRPPSLVKKYNADGLLPVPKALLDWLNSYHNPYSSAGDEVFAHHPNPSNHPNFWEVLFSFLVRGKLKDAIRLLKVADFSVATTSWEDGPEEEGYHGAQLINIQRAISQVVQLLEGCPALENGDWHIKGPAWRMFRQRVTQVLNNLSASNPAAPDRSRFSKNLGDAASPDSPSGAQSNVPWSMIQNLKITYGILLGGTTEISSYSQDWLEATIALTAWWDGEDEEMVLGSMMASKRGWNTSRPLSDDSTNLDYRLAYLQRLSLAFHRATSDGDDEVFQVNSNNPLEVALASILEGDAESAVRILRNWSLTIATAMAEIGTLSGWLNLAQSERITDGFDQSDLMVLHSLGQRWEACIDRDDILIEYARGLAKKDQIKSVQNVAIEGWEMALQILGRVKDDARGSDTARELLDQIRLDSASKVDKLLDLCHNLGMSSQAHKLSEKYASWVVDNSCNYGDALFYYSRAHNSQKVKLVLDHLVSVCLDQSISYPAQVDLDERLRNFINDPKECLLILSEYDYPASVILQNHLSGYATLRKFYDLRDEEVNFGQKAKSKIPETARMRECASAILALVSSAGSVIDGGLYDKGCSAVVRVELLLVLLAEALVFVNQPKPLLTLPQSFSLLKAIEDLQSIGGRVYANCDERFQSALSNASSQNMSGSHRNIKKVTSSMTSSSGFSLIDSSMLTSQMSTSQSIENSGVLIKSNVKRGWDWRKIIASDTTSERLLRLLRIGLATQIAHGWVGYEGAERSNFIFSNCFIIDDDDS
ncbi:MAG: hypothetical protein M1829_006347 [Trizodia sp. TS-e1964]|nr:MAG: hypothetical protein M1829_006347 [Trizodia sp. TS-e1964]